MTSQLKSELGASQVYATQAGHELAGSNDGLFALLSDSMRILFEGSEARKDFERIGSGEFSTVYGVPGHDGLCIKVFDPTLSKAGWKLGLDEIQKGEDLVAQTRFLDLLNHYLGLDGRGERGGIFVPSQYLAARNGHGVHVNVQERIPESYITVKSYGNKLQKEGKFSGKKDEIDWADDFFDHLRKRISSTVANCLLERCLDDANGGNVMVDSNADSVEDSRLYLIDMPHFRFRTAKAITRLSGLLFR